MQRMLSFPAKRWPGLYVPLWLLMLLLVGCSHTGSEALSANSRGSATPMHTPALTPTPQVPGFGPQACPPLVQDLNYWDSLIPTQPNVSHVSGVTCGYLKDTPTLQALVTVLYDGIGSLVDVYVYDDLDAATPQQIFLLQNLYEGSAHISQANTVITSEVDLQSPTNRQKTGDQLTADLFREFQWSAGAGTLVQVAFPGLFPDVTRYQAEEDQAQAEQEHAQQTWKFQATATAQHMAQSLLGWNLNASATVVSGGGLQDTQALIDLKPTASSSQTIVVTLARLNAQVSGIWLVTHVTTAGLSLSSPDPQATDLVHSPLSVTGTGAVLAGSTGHVKLLDDRSNDLGEATVQSTSNQGNTMFSIHVHYRCARRTGCANRAKQRRGRPTGCGDCQSAVPISSEEIRLMAGRRGS
jgi:hypothetical protein